MAQIAQVEANLTLLLKKRSSRQDELLLPVVKGSSLGEQLKSVASSFPEFSESGSPDAAEANFIQTVVRAHLHLVQGDFQQAAQTLGSFPIPNNPSLVYTKAAAFKAKAILGAAFQLYGNSNGAILTYKDPLGKPSYPEEVAWAEVLYYKFASLVTSDAGTVAPANSKSLTLYALREYSNIAGRSQVAVGDRNSRLALHRLFLDHASSELANDPSNLQLQNDVRQISQSYEGTLFNGSAGRGNSEGHGKGDSSIEEYLRVLLQNWRATTTLTVPNGRIVDKHQISYANHIFEVLKKAAFTSFHSPLVMRYHVEVLSALGHYSEAMAAFDTYSAYQETHRIRVESGGDLEGRQGDSTSGVCEAFHKVINIAIHINRDRNKAKDLADRLSTWIPHVDAPVDGIAGLTINGSSSEVTNGHANGIPNGHANGAINGTVQEHSKKEINGSVNGNTNGKIDVARTTTVASDVPPEVLAKAYGAVADAYAYYSKATFSDESQFQSIITTACENYEQSLKVWPQHSTTSYNYALLLAQNADPSKALEVVRNGLVYKQNHYPSWHLLALLLTSRDEYEAANKLLNSAIELAIKEYEEGTLGGIEVRGCVLQMKLTQLAIIEATANIETVLDYLPETLALYGQLFPNSQPVINKEGVNTNTKDEVNDHAVKSRRTLSRIKTSDRRHRSRSKSRGHATNTKTAPTSDVEDEQLSKPTELLQQQLFQDVWLYIAGVYRRAKMDRDAEECIVEAEHMFRESADTQVELGQLMANDRPLHSLKQFEAALDENGDHLNATLSLAELVLSHSRLGKSDKSAEATSSSSVQPFEFFISHKDELAAHARLQSLLETQVTKSPGRYSSEAWFFLGSMYEKAGEDKNAQNALWKSVQIEEVRGVRDYSISRYYELK
ncbi:Ypp1p [Sugiyamaella lignohabitans]|uniref:Cargo-transport protein YPP1 n=1 Tax=Sugiyamaella lignohabitans TaxID=796027 RepID=A0A161HLD8_9ASCO|nr:Ypp1p [Sugiyamaella lignohabitans]ANB12858.1 Ypp1p [Sugiyamaella lignohabitans]